MRCQYCGWPFPDPKRSSLWGLVGLLAGWTAISVFYWTVARANAGAPHGELGAMEYNFSNMITQLILGLIAFGPAALVMRLRREPWASAGVSSHNLGKALAVGLTLGAITVAGVFFGSDLSIGEVARNLGPSDFWAFLQYSVVGFGEEFAFRGFLQSRLIGWVGRWQGWLAASVLMALAHVVQRITMMGMVGVEAWLSSAALIPISLLMGYVMLRTENIVAPGLFHTFADWVGTLG